jgi:hypothetical protein
MVVEALRARFLPYAVAQAASLIGGDTLCRLWQALAVSPLLNRSA